MTVPCIVTSMAHYVFTGNVLDGLGRPERRVLAVAMDIDEKEAIRIAREMTRDYQETGELLSGSLIDYQEVQAYLPHTPREGDVITASIARTLPASSIIRRGLGGTPLIRQGGGYVSVSADGLEPTPLIDGHHYRILHVGKTEPNQHGRTP